VTDTATRPDVGARAPGIGESAPRPDGIPKVLGEFAFGNDLWAEGMLWGATLRSPHPHARIRTVDVTPALRIPGVHAVLTADDVTGSRTYGLEHADQPVFASDIVRYVGEPIAAVAADHPETARRAAASIAVDFEVFEPLVDAEAAFTTAPIHPEGNVFRHVKVRHGDPAAVGEILVEGEYAVGMQDQAFLGPESGLAIPAEDGGVELFIATQWLHADQRQVAACLGLPAEKVRLVLAGTGGAFGAREDVSLQIHVCLLALHTGRPVKMQYNREESFFGHVHRHPARLRYRHHATADGRLVKVEARLLLDGGAYASTSSAVIANATYFSCGPYRVPNAVIDGYAVRTNNPPCGAMRGFGAVQACFAHESQMDRLADVVGISPLEIRLRNAMTTGDTLITGQVVDGPAPVEELLRRLADAPLPLPPDPGGGPLMARPGGAGRTADAEHVRRGVGWAVSIKNLMFSEGFDDYSTARVVLEHGVATVHCACAGSGRASSRSPSRSPARSSGSTRSSLRRRTRASVRPGRRRRAGRRGCPGGPSPAPAGRSRSRWPRTLGTRATRRRSSTATARPSEPTRTARETSTPASRSPPTAQWSTSTRGSGWCASWRSPPRRTSGG
jgi:CO/xanthine dehydrogenase Mo-binding subunit